jgi:TonB family protein
MKLSLLFSFTLHILFFAALLISKPGNRKWEGYPTVIPVELVKIEPVSYKAPEVEKIEPRKQEVKPEPKKIEGITLEKKPKRKERIEKPKEPETVKDSKKGKSVVGGKSVRLDVKEFPFSYYLALLQTRIQSNWEPPFQTSRKSISKRTIVYFKIQRGGQITNILIEESSGDYLFDQAAVRAVTLANPLPPLPFDFPERELGVHFEFEQGI